MFIPAYYRNTDLKEIESFIKNNSFATLITNVNDEPFASHIPVELGTNKEQLNILSGHLSAANPQAKNLKNGDRALIIFQGPHTYISSSWYNHINVPTWNYIAVHVYGKVKILTELELRSRLEEMVTKYEVVSKKPFQISNLPSEMMDKYLKGIIGFDISMDRVEGKWKMSQNRDAEDHANIIRELEQLDDLNARMVADIMKTAK